MKKLEIVLNEAETLQSRELRTAYGKASFALTELDTLIRRDKTMDSQEQKKALDVVGNAIEALDKLSDYGY